MSPPVHRHKDATRLFLLGIKQKGIHLILFDVNSLDLLSLRFQPASRILLFLLAHPSSLPSAPGSPLHKTCSLLLPTIQRSPPLSHDCTTESSTSRNELQTADRNLIAEFFANLVNNGLLLASSLDVHETGTQLVTIASRQKPHPTNTPTIPSEWLSSIAHWLQSTMEAGIA